MGRSRKGINTDKSLDEIRFLLIARLKSNCWSAIYTWRKGKIRIISVRKARKNEDKSITASEFDQKFDKGDDMTEFLDLDHVSKPGNSPKSITVNFPEWMVKDLDRVSKKLGVSRQSIIKIFISEKLKEQQNL